MVDLDQLVTKNFRLREFAVSAHHPELAAAITFTEAEVEKIYLLCATILQPIRNRFGPVIVTSGKRPEELNEVVGGDDDSQHLYCEVGDIETPEAEIEVVHTWVATTLPHAFGQCLLYYDEHLKPKLIHVGLPSRRIRSSLRVGYKFSGAFHPRPPS